MIDVDAHNFIAAWGALQRGIAEGYLTSMRDAVAVAERRARESTLFHDRSGGTRASIRSNEFAGYGEVRMGGAAQFLEHGTQPHVIEPSNATALRFFVNGQPRFAMRVQHPGTQPRPVVGNAGQAGGQVLQRELEEKVSEAAAKFSGG